MDERVTVYRYVGEKGESTTIEAFFKGDKLVVQGCDTDPSAVGTLGDWDYEYWLYADKAICPGNILEILKSGFRGFTAIKRWFDEQQIDYDVVSYA